MGAPVAHTPPKPPATGKSGTTAAGGSAVGTAGAVAAGGVDAAATDASMSAMMATMAHNTIIGNLASIAESNNNLTVNGTGGITKVTSNVGRNLKDAAG